MTRVSFPPVLPGLMAAGVILAAPVPLQAQTESGIRLCHVPGSGAVYRVGAPNTRPRCASGHVAFSWAGAADAGAVSAAAVTANDPYPQYLLADGLRMSNNGFAVTDNPRVVGTIPARGRGTRLLWYPEKAAFRAGAVYADNWDDANIGRYSIGLGHDTKARGQGSVALGLGSEATSSAATALGHGTTASGTTSTALGDRTTASGSNSTAMGVFTVASGAISTAMGHRASTNGRKGAFVYGDASTQNPVQATLPNQFVVRAQHVWLGRTNAVGSGWGGFLETSTGASLSWGGTWTNSSDAARKENFAAVDAEEMLEKLHGLPVRTWNYMDEAPTVRHLGPTAQDFHAAFGLGGSDKSIATVDADGVALAAIQALAKRTAELRRENDLLRAELVGVLERIADLEAAQRLR